MLRTLFAVGFLAGGCDASHVLGGVDEGADSGGTGGTTVIVDAGLPTVDAGAAIDVGPLGPTESWNGYFENFQFSSGSDAVNLSFASDPTGVVVGTATFGAGTPPPPATDPNAAYPPGANLEFIDYGPLEGFPYTMIAAALTPSRLHFTVYMAEVWASWCALQTPVPGSNSCLPNWGGVSSAAGCSQTNPATGQSVPVSCAKLDLCGANWVCICSAAGCETSQQMWPIEIDVAITGATAAGSVAGLAGVTNVRFTDGP